MRLQEASSFVLALIDGDGAIVSISRLLSLIFRLSWQQFIDLGPCMVDNVHMILRHSQPTHDSSC
jgi:hypothetical protein